MGSAIDYNDHRIDETAQIILRILRDTGRRATAGELRKEAGLDETNPVHYRVENHLSPIGLVERAGREERPGGAQDEVVYRLTDDGVAFVDTHQNKLTDAVAASEAVKTLRRIRANVEGYDNRITILERHIENWRQWKNRWSTRVGRVEDNANLLEEQQEDHSRRITQNGRMHEINDGRIDNFQTRLKRVESKVERVDDRMETLEEEISKRPTEDEIIENIKVLRDELGSDIEDIREDAEGFF